MKLSYNDDCCLVGVLTASCIHNEAAFLHHLISHSNLLHLSELPMKNNNYRFKDSPVLHFAIQIQNLMKTIHEGAVDSIPILPLRLVWRKMK